MRLYDTARREVVPFEPGPGRHDVHVRHHAVRRHPPRPRRRRTSPTTSSSAACATSATRPAACATSPTSTTDPRQGPRARRPLPRPRRRRDRPLRRRHGAPSACCRRGASPGPPRPSPTSAASSAWCSTGATPTRPAAPSTSTCRRSPRFGQCQPLRPRRDARAAPPSGAATPTTPTSATRSTSCCGSRRSTTSRRGSRCGARAGPGWHIECSALALRELGTTIDLHGGGSRPDLPAPRVRARPSPRRPPASRSCATGCTRRWCGWTARRCRSRSATSCSSPTCARSGTPVAIRLAVVEHHYRTPWEWDDDLHAARPRRGSSAGAAAGDGRRRARRGAGRARRRPRHARRGRRHRRRGGRRARASAPAAALLGVTL